MIIILLPAVVIQLSKFGIYLKIWII